MTQEERDELRYLHRLQEHLKSQGFSLNLSKKVRMNELEIQKIWEKLS